jgi:hypothetical protein
MSKNLARLLSVASEPISSTPAIGELSRLPALSGSRGQELMSLLGSRNGFYTFESALLVRPLDFDASPLGIFQWNNAALWRSEYKADLGVVVFFAEDIFGVQFCIKDDSVNSFNPETGEFKVIAASLEDWSGWVMEDSKTRTGWPLAHFWQLRQGALKLGTRLLPKVPFVLEGRFEIENLYELNDVEGMRFRASIANQLRDCPDGSKVVLKVQRARDHES